MNNKRNILFIILVNIVLLIVLCESIFVVYYYLQDNQYLSVPEKLAAEKSSFEVEKNSTNPCNKYKNVLLAHPYLAFVHTSRPECQSYSNNTGHRGPDMPYRKNPQDYVVLVLGGSVASQLFQFQKKEIHAYFSKKHPTKHVVVLNGALEGWKQPQQLFMLQLYGEVVDAVISIEGFNEMIFNHRLNYNLRFDAPFVQGYRKANSSLLRNEESQSLLLAAWLFDLVNNNALLRHSKTAYFISDKIRTALAQHINAPVEEKTLVDSLGPLKTVFVLPPEWSNEQKKQYAIEQYLKYLSLMQATAKTYGIPLAIFLQPAPAIDKTLSGEEIKLVGDLAYREDYRLFEKTLLAHNNTLPIYSLLHVFASTPATIYKDGIHYEQASPGPTLVMQEIFRILDQRW